MIEFQLYQNYILGMASKNHYWKVIMYYNIIHVYILK